MKKHLLLILGSLLTSHISQAQWVTQPIGFTNLAGSSSLVMFLDAVDPNVVWTGAVTLTSTGTAFDKQYARTTNGGATWTTGTVTGLVGNEGINCIAGLSASAAIIATTTRSTTGGVKLHRLFKTTDGGTTWIPVLSLPGDSEAGSINFFNANEGVVIASPASYSIDESGNNLSGFTVYTTADAGSTWTRVTGLPVTIGLEELGNTPGLVTQAAVIGNHTWFGTSRGRVFHSANKGQTWTVTNTGLGTYISGIAFRDESNGLAMITSSRNTAHSIVRTTDGGTTWTRITYQGPLHGYGLSQVPGTNNYISTGINVNNSDTGSSYSRDNGQTWIQLENVLDHITVDAVSPTVVWTGSYGSNVYKLNTTVLNSHQDAALQRGLSVFPNPSTDGQFTVQLGLSLNATAKVCIFDALGRNVYTQEVKATAKPVFNVDLTQQSAGVYTLQVQAENGIAQQKLMIK